MLRAIMEVFGAVFFLWVVFLGAYSWMKRYTEGPPSKSSRKRPY